jgi:phosphoenolpyruvate phosphomutase
MIETHNSVAGVEKPIASTRRTSIRDLLDAKGFIRALETHSPLCGLIVENEQVTRSGQTVAFDAMWSSSLTDSTLRGKPDIEVVDLNSRLQTVYDILEVTQKPIIYDADTGGKPEHLHFTVRTLERAGVSAVIIEDKTGLKKNSLLGRSAGQAQERPEQFSDKVRIACSARRNAHFLVIARIESLVLGEPQSDALQRALAYTEAGADGIMIHSKKPSPVEVLQFASDFRKHKRHVPLVVVPSTFSSVTEQELVAAGFNIVIYANQLLRAAYPAMRAAAHSILKHQRAFECEHQLMSIEQILNLVPGTK